MKIERTRNAARNIVFGSILKAYQIIMPFIMRTAMIYLLGMEYTGLNSLFTSILQVLNLAELGIGSAMVYSMYEPIAKDDSRTICALLSLYHKYYRIIGGVVLIGGLGIMPFLPKLVKMDTVPTDVNIYFLFLIHLSATVLTYWLFSYLNSLLQAFQRIDIISKINLITSSIQYAIQLFVLFVFHNYYYFVITIIVTQILTNIVTAIVVRRMYPGLKAEGILEKSEIQTINKRVRDLFTSRIGMVVVNSADTLVISAFLGMTALAQYQNYYYILTAVIGMVTVVFQACTAGIGNSLIIETKEKNFNDLRKLTLLIAWIGGFCCACFLCLFQPFMEVWVGKENVLAFSIVICFAIYFFIYEINQLLNLYKDAAGIWHEDRFRPLMTAIANLGMNLIMVQFWGLYGIILSTVLSMALVGMPWLLYNLFSTIFDMKYSRMYIHELVFYVVVTALVCAVTFLSVMWIKLPAVPLLGIRFIFCVVVPNLLLLLIYRNRSEFRSCIELLDNITNRRLHLWRLIPKSHRIK